MLYVQMMIKGCNQFIRQKDKIKDLVSEKEDIKCNITIKNQKK